MKVAVIIPARMAATRFPNKPLALIAGLPMIEHVRRRCEMADLVDEVHIATCDQEIIAAVREFGGKAIMTAPTHERCTDRVAEASAHIDADIIINVQGDEPLVPPSVLDLLAKQFQQEPELECVNLVSPIFTKDAFHNKNVVKTVLDLKGNILYLSREPIPNRTKLDPTVHEPIAIKQLGIIAFRRKTLMEFYKLPPTPLEKAESVDMLRFLENGRSIRAVVTTIETQGVDIPADVTVVEKLLKTDKLFPIYSTKRN